MAKKWSGAGTAYCKSADIQMQLQNKHECATNLVDAAGCYKKADPQEAITCFSRVTNFQYVFFVFIFRVDQCSTVP